jgi:hypothetical protein
LTRIQALIVENRRTNIKRDTHPAPVCGHATLYRPPAPIIRFELLDFVHFVQSFHLPISTPEPRCIVLIEQVYVSDKMISVFFHSSKPHIGSVRCALGDLKTPVQCG